MPPTNLVLPVICICAAIIIFFLLAQFTSFRQRPTLHRTPAAVRSLLDPIDRPSMDTLLHSRASPNSRLIRAFHLSNTFVSSDPTVHTNFNHNSVSLIRAAEKNWPRFSDIALQAAELALPNDSTTPFHVYVGAVTLRTIIAGLLVPDADVASLDANDVDVVAELITELWIRSKKPARIPEHLLETLNFHVRHLVPDQVQYPQPLDFIIPTWETLWRVVAATLACVYGNIAARQTFLDLNENPNLDQFSTPKQEGSSPSAKDYICESLRLYPPVKRITRHIFTPLLFTTFLPRFLASRIPPYCETHVAEIERAQCSAYWDISSSSPEAFDAARFLDPARKASDLLAFGAGPLKCRAINWAPMAAAVIVGAILNTVDEVKYTVIQGNGIGDRGGWDGWEVRKAA
ncbi:hypothetical protein R3P38DRAFT_2616511 [Favolaschia claudopus]|uniref:Cytochrome P450 n=1 Tax=Favolaschia claudopus TaxID=2862362 RepID=A0AAW0C8D2_9AGAR